MSIKYVSKNLFLLKRIIPIEINRTLSSTCYHWKILGIGACKKLASKAQDNLQSLGYKNTRVIGINDTKESDEEFIKKLKEEQWDAISIGGYVNGFDLNFPINDNNVPKNREDILIWFNRILNLIHEQAPKSKIILVKSPEDIHERIQRIMKNKSND
ncbi:unnamed protein product [Adineta steineri]|uniref:Uncharacterized protein n=1 Tax=Adineta steineri TaxID=433720 RepID=A0A814RIZ8_9BILA|nr:unnamed protein product [Adineta steineri]CAF1132874.1 unnamed protein product [Adineta steineri]CAF3504989.1 unnamed protein product [Adineta steineri]CAF3883264.1 unnamed protein product [Adineta steineri]